MYMLRVKCILIFFFFIHIYWVSFVAVVFVVLVVSTITVNCVENNKYIDIFE